MLHIRLCAHERRENVSCAIIKRNVARAGRVQSLDGPALRRAASEPYDSWTKRKHMHARTPAVWIGTRDGLQYSNL